MDQIKIYDVKLDSKDYILDTGIVVVTPNKTLSGAENYPVYIGKEIVI